LRHERRVLSEATATVPALEEDRFLLGADWAEMVVKYTRYRNAPARFSGDHPSLTSGGMGVGIGPSFGVWYLGDTTRIFVNGRNVFAEYDASDMTWESGPESARVELEWEAPEAKVRLHVAVPDNRSTAYVRYRVEAGQDLASIRVLLRCFPGAYAGGQEGMPSHRWVSTPDRSVEVRRGESVRTLSFSHHDDWVFYADRYHDPAMARGFGAAGLVLGGNRDVKGEVKVNPYGVDTWLTCPPHSTDISFALRAFPHLPNDLARYELRQTAEADRRALSARRVEP
jgi:hypothetical protein